MGLPSLTSRLSQVSERVLDAVYPPEPLDVGRLRMLDAPWCATCGFPFEYGVADFALECAACARFTPRYDRARSAFAYDDASAPLVLAFKHGGRTHQLEMFARQMMRAGRELLRDADVLIPVPLHPSRLRARKFNQAALLARRLSRLSGVPMDVDALRRVKKTDSQGRKSRRQRRLNVRAAFRVAGEAPERVLLIDDVMTTGATLEACALVLRRAGARRVDALTLARVVRERDET